MFEVDGNSNCSRFKAAATYKFNKFMILRFLLLSLGIISTLGCSNPNKYTIEGVINGNYKGYIYFSYNNLRDSCLVRNNNFHFQGENFSDVVYLADFSTHRTSAMNKTFYLENKKIKINISIENKIINKTELDWIIINDVSGTKTNIIQKNYEKFVMKYQTHKDWNAKQYFKVDKIVSDNPKNQYSAELLQLLIQSDSLVETEPLQKIYKKLDLKSQNSTSIHYIKRLIYPHESPKLGQSIYDFELIDSNGKMINTTEFRGSILLIDFWASWCKPCRTEFPKISKIRKEFYSKNFKILGVSLDESEKSWIRALKEENLQWDNVLDTTSFIGQIATEYDISFIPSNILVDENGIIIAINLKPKEIENELNKLFVSKL